MFQQHIQKQRDFAISKLRRVYSDASKVLVIDKHLMQISSDPTEQMMQLLGSEWQRRLWTLQEGRLARELFVQFEEGAIAVSQLAAQKPLLDRIELGYRCFLTYFQMLKLLMERHFIRKQDPQAQFHCLG